MNSQKNNEVSKIYACKLRLSSVKYTITLLDHLQFLSNCFLNVINSQLQLLRFGFV